MAYVPQSDRIKSDVRTTWLYVAIAAAIGVLLLNPTVHRDYRYGTDIMPVGLLIVVAIFAPVLICAHVANFLGFDELSLRQCRVVRAGVVLSIITLWVAAKMIDIAALF
jgi:hypothetical protein